MDVDARPKACFGSFSGFPSFSVWVAVSGDCAKVGRLPREPGVNFWFLRGGRIRKRVEMKSLWVNSDQLIAA